MSSTTKMFKVIEPAANPAARFTPAGRIAAAATLVLGAGFQLASWLTEPAADGRTLDRLQWIADHPATANVAKVLDLLAMPFLFGTVLVYVLLSRQRSPRLAYAGGILLGTGMVGLSAVMGLETLEFALAQDGRFDPTALAHVVDDVSAAPAITMALLLIPGAVLGLLTIAVALWRSACGPARRHPPDPRVHRRGPLPADGARRPRDLVHRSLLDRLGGSRRGASLARDEGPNDRVAKEA